VRGVLAPPHREPHARAHVVAESSKPKQNLLPVLACLLAVAARGAYPSASFQNKLSLRRRPARVAYNVAEPRAAPRHVWAHRASWAARLRGRPSMRTRWCVPCPL
jgi:hypothetical protein